MIHRERVWQVRDLSPEELAGELKRHSTWSCCSGFRAAGMLWLNDATSPDGGQEYAVVRESDGRQVESVTVGWCTLDDLQAYINKYITELATMPTFGSWTLTPASLSHGRQSCRHCA